MSVSSFRMARGALLALAVPAALGAQQQWSPFVAFGSASSAGPLNPASGMSALVIEPGALVESARGTLLTRWSAPVAASAFQITDADLAMRIRLQSSRKLETSLLATGRYDHATIDAPATANSSLHLQLGTRSTASGFQFGAGVDGWRSSINGNAVVVPATTVSGWIRRFGLAFTAQISARALPGSVRVSNDTIVYSAVPDTGRRFSVAAVDTPIVSAPVSPFTPQPPIIYRSKQVSDGHAFGEASLRVSGMLMAMGIDGQAGIGVASGGRARGFGSLILTRWMSPGLALTAGVVIQPPEPGSSGGRTGGLLGIRLAPGPHLFPHFVNAPKVGASACSIRVADGATIIELRAPAASHVELSGDFTRWLPVALEHVRGDRWALTTRLAPGVHRFVVRVDGGTWLPAPGLPQSVDAYDGTVSVIVSP